MFKQAFSVVLQQILPASYLILNQPFALIFKTTNYCNYRCAHCLESAGAENPKTFIPTEIIKEYIVQAKKHSQFSHDIVLTGGEIFTAYESDENYVPDILNFCAVQSVRADIKTNGAWIKTRAKEKILTDLKKLTYSIPKKQIKGDPVRLSAGMLQMSLSLDRYHKDSVKNTCQIIVDIAHNRDNNMVFNVTGFSQDISLQDKLLSALTDAGLNLDKCAGLSGNKVIVLNKNNLLYFSSADLMQAGRAKKLAEAELVTNSEFKILSPEYNILMCFRDDGWVILGENSGPKIKTKWQKKNGSYKSLNRIRMELVWNAFLAQCRTRQIK